MAYKVSDIKKGLKIELDGAPYTVVYFQFVKPGKGQAFTRTRVKNLITGAVLERTFKIAETLAEADVEVLTMQYLYSDGEFFHFMDIESFEQIGIPVENLEDESKWLLEEMQIEVLFYKGKAVSVDLPHFVELEITYCEPGAKGNTAQGATKTATLSTGAEVQVPLFIEQGTTIKVDTREGKYVERVNK
ncbi:MAG: elongation factor P [Myxococcota bacterium]